MAVVLGLLGLFLVLFGAIFFFAGSGLSVASALFAGTLAGSPLMQRAIFAGFGFGIGLLGVVFLAIGLVKGEWRPGLAKRILETGFIADATITYLDKNHGLLVNNQPVYSIVEFTFRDSNGKERKGRKSKVDSDLAVRLSLQVGGTVRVKYLRDTPDNNLLVLPDPQGGGGQNVLA